MRVGQGQMASCCWAYAQHLEAQQRTSGCVSAKSGCCHSLLGVEGNAPQLVLVAAALLQPGLEPQQDGGILPPLKV